MSEENRSTHKLYEKEKIGEVQIADEVVAIIAGLAATEVEGVDSMAGNITNELVGKLGMKNLSKGVKVDVTEEHVSADLSLNIRYGYNIPSVSEQVQEKVSTAIENMTGLTVLDVNVKIVLPIFFSSVDPPSVYSYSIAYLVAFSSLFLLLWCMNI